MTRRELEAECRTYCRYLTGMAPTEYVVAKYVDFHQRSGVREATSFDRILLGISRRGPLWARLADSYAARFCRGSALRKKLALTLALAECSPSLYRRLELPDSTSRMRALLGLAGQLASHAALLAAATLTLGPAHLLMRAVRGTRIARAPGQLAGRERLP